MFYKIGHRAYSYLHIFTSVFCQPVLSSIFFIAYFTFLFSYFQSLHFSHSHSHTLYFLSLFLFPIGYKRMRIRSDHHFVLGKLTHAHTACGLQYFSLSRLVWLLMVYLPHPSCPIQIETPAPTTNYVVAWYLTITSQFIVIFQFDSPFKIHKMMNVCRSSCFNFNEISHKSTYLLLRLKMIASASHPSSAVWQDLVIYWTLDNFLKPLAGIKLPKSSPFLGNFCEGVKINYISSEIIFGQPV